MALAVNCPVMSAVKSPSKPPVSVSPGVIVSESA
jgi:hypothetical protein